MKLNKEICGVIAVVALCFFITACGKETDNSELIEKDEHIQETLAKSEIDYNQAYESLIVEWEKALKNEKNGEYTADEMLSFSFYGYGDNPKAYYAFYDIDDNGVSELILKKEAEYEDIIAYIFTLKDGVPINIFGYCDDGKPKEVPWSRVGSSYILDTGLIDSQNGDYSIYRISDDGYTVDSVAHRHPYDYPNQANLAEAKWKFYIHDTITDRESYVKYLNELGYIVGGDNTLANIEWKEIK